MIAIIGNVLAGLGVVPLFGATPRLTRRNPGLTSAVAAPVRRRVARPPAADELTLADTEAVRLMLRGDSVIDWHRLAFVDHAEVDRFLRLNEFDPDSAEELARLEDMRG